MADSLVSKIASFPKSSGIYWMKDAAGCILYVGKAKNIRQRVKSYFRTDAGQRAQIEFLMRRTADMEYLVTDNEKEALLLENTFIKKHKPRYNIFFKDDKSYASLKINARHPFPGIFVTRHIAKDGSLYFGPYSSAFALRQTTDLLTKTFQLRTCSNHEFANRSRPCMEYDIGRCSAPCVGKISEEAYAKQVAAARLFLEGKKKELLQILKEKMAQAAHDLKYEEAARFRDLILHVKETLKEQKVIHHEGGDYDCVGLTVSKKRCGICILFIRRGILVDRRHFIFPKPAGFESSYLSQFLIQYYGVVLDPPPEILLPLKIESTLQMEELFFDRCGHSVKLSNLKYGKKAKMLKMAATNARQWLDLEKAKEIDLPVILQEKLGLTEEPHRIECVDISNLQGKEAVGSIVCFEDGLPLKSRYRRFKIQFNEGPNDYAMMREVLFRRFRRALDPKWSLPDLLLVDGGKGQLAIAVKVLADLGLHLLSVAAIAKPHGDEKSDKIYIPGRKNPVALLPHSPALLYLIRIRDEAHRFALAYHHKLVRNRILHEVSGSS